MITLPTTANLLGDVWVISYYYHVYNMLHNIKLLKK